MPKFTVRVKRTLEQTAEFEISAKEGEEDDKANEELDRLMSDGKLGDLEWSIEDDETEVESIEEA